MEMILKEGNQVSQWEGKVNNQILQHILWIIPPFHMLLEIAPSWFPM